MDQQELIVARDAATAWANEVGVGAPTPEIVGDDPPDVKFSVSGLTIGAELFELDAHYNARALVERLTNATYAEMHARNYGDRYRGVTTGIVASLEMETDASIVKKWNRLGFRKRQAKRFAKEFAHLLEQSAGDATALPQTMPGFHTEIDGGDYPMLRAFGRWFTASRCAPRDIRRSDGRAAPLVILAGSTLIRSEEIERSIEKKLRDKAKGRRRWGKVDRALLVMHDLPRDHFYQGWGYDWGARAERAVRNNQDANAFDEIWVITYENQNGHARRIAGDAPAIT